MRRAATAAVALAVVAAALGPAAVGSALAFVDGSPDLGLTASDNRVVAGERTTLGVTVTNTGDIDTAETPDPSEKGRVTTARGTTLRMRSGNAPITVRSGPVALGSVPEGSVGPSRAPGLAFEVAVAEDADPGRYRVPVEVEYTYTPFITDQGTIYGSREVTETLYVTLVVEETARFAVVDSATDAAVGGEGTVRVTLRNDGSAPARDATVTLQSGTPDLRVGGAGAASSYAGTWKPGETRTFAYGATVAPGTPVRSLALSAVVDYESPVSVPRSERLATGVRPAAAGAVAIVESGTTAAVGDSGRLSVTLRNRGEEQLTDATVRLQSSNAALAFAGSPSAATFVGPWAPGETRTVAVETSFAPTAEERVYAVDATVAYTATDGRQASTRPVTLGVTPAPEQSFDVASPTATLRVGDEGTLRGTLVNGGPGDVENAVLVLEPPGSVTATEREFALGDLAADERADFRYDVEVSSSARAGPRQFTYRVRYEDTDGTTVTSDPLYVRAAVDPERSVFDVEPVSATVGAGSSARFVVEVTNRGDEELSDISAKLFADSPLSVSDDEAFVDALGPGESTRIEFRVSAAGGATAKAYPVSMDFQYDEPDGDTKLSDTYQLPVRVEQRDGGGLFGFLGSLAGAPDGLSAAVGVPAGVDGLSGYASVGGLAALAGAAGLVRRRQGR